jgi:carbamoyl-phosphate synthase small subunit
MQLNAQLVLKSGEVFHGKVPDSQDTISFGEVVFNTGMVGYVETLTDPSYAGQILVFTYPLMGNYGVSGPDTWESKKIHAKGAIFSELSPFYSNHAAEKSLKTWLEEQKIPYMTGVDTRALTKCLRDKGVVPGAIVPEGKTASEFGDFEHTNWVKEVSIKTPEVHGSGDKLIIAVDCGMKENIMRNLLKFPVRVKRVPHDYDYSTEEYDGVFLSNGPGDPVTCEATTRVLSMAMQKKKPIFGICLGTQLMALAVGAKTFKMPFGHRSQNQPCLYIPTNRSYLTSQNHGYAIDEATLPQGWQVSFRNLNDQSVAGIEHESLPFFSVQFHPESAPGPEDTEWLFKKFIDSVLQ